VVALVVFVVNIHRTSMWRVSLLLCLPVTVLFAVDGISSGGSLLSGQGFVERFPVLLAVAMVALTWAMGSSGCWRMTTRG